MGRFFRQVPLLVILIHQIIFLPVASAREQSEGQASVGSMSSGDSFTVKKDDPSYRSGSVFISSNKKNEVLLKANIWGAVQFPGVHYMPIGTRFLDALSFAGGPLDSANVDSITLSSKPVTQHSSEDSLRMLSVKDALTSEKSNPIVQPDDIIVVKEDRSDSRIMRWLAIGTFIISAAALGIVISRN
jgi:SLBB domain